MSNTDDTKVDTAAIKTKLRKLIGKHGTSEREKQEFVEKWVDLALEEGLSDEAVELFFKGFSLAQSYPLHKLAEQTGEDAYGKLCDTSDCAKKNARNEILKAGMNLFSLELIAPTSSTSLDTIARHLPKFIWRNSGNDYVVLWSKGQCDLLVTPLIGKAISEDAHMEESNALKLLELFQVTIAAYLSKPRDDESIDAVMMLMGWLEGQAGKPEGSITGSLVKKANSRQETKASKGSTPLEASPSDTSMATNEDGAPMPEASQSDASGKAVAAKPVPDQKNAKASQQRINMKDVLKFLGAYQKEHESRGARIKELNSERAEMLSQISDLNTQLQKAEQEIETLKNSCSSLSNNYSKLQEKLASLQEDNQSLHERLTAAEEVATMISSRDAHKSDATLQRLAQELKTDYNDFLASENDSMTADLGEILRLQMRGIFDVLKSHGIDL